MSIPVFGILQWLAVWWWVAAKSLWRFTSPYMVWSPVTLGPHHWLFSALFSYSVLLPVPRMDTLAHCRFKATSLWLPPSPLLALSSVPFHQDVLCSLYFRLHLSLNKYLSTPYPPFPLGEWRLLSTWSVKTFIHVFIFHPLPVLKCNVEIFFYLVLYPQCLGLFLAFNRLSINFLCKLTIYFRVLSI